MLGLFARHAEPRTVHTGIRVIIYGEHDPWRDALSPGAPVWALLDAVEDVVMVPDFAGAPIPRPGPPTVIIPLMEIHARHCPRQYRSLIPDARSIDILGDKAAFARYVEDIGLTRSCPQTYAQADDAVFPCVVKCTDLNGGDGVAVARSRPELDALMAQSPWRDSRVILQSLIPGATDYVTHCVCKDGRILWHCSFAYDLDAPDVIRKGPIHTGLARAVTASPATLSQIEAFLKPLSYNGPCNVDYKLGPGGAITVFEINPRLGGSLMTKSNVDLLRDALTHIIEAAT